jgi:hypothetical protein
MIISQVTSVFVHSPKYGGGPVLAQKITAVVIADDDTGCAVEVFQFFQTG